MALPGPVRVNSSFSARVVMSGSSLSGIARSAIGSQNQHRLFHERGVDDILDLDRTALHQPMRLVVGEIGLEAGELDPAALQGCENAPNRDPSLKRHM